MQYVTVLDRKPDGDETSAVAAGRHDRMALVEGSLQYLTMVA
jgi:hypothetical protein